MFVSNNDTGEEAHNAFKHYDLGDILGAVGRAVQDQDRRAFRARFAGAPADQGAAPAAGKIPRPVRPGAEIPPALSRPDHQRGCAQGVHDAHQDHPGDPRILHPPRLSGSGNADDAPDPRRRGGQAVRDAPQRAGHEDVPAHRAGAVSETPGGGRLREGVRDQPQFPQRGAVHTPQPGIHHAGILRSVSRLQIPDGFQRKPVPRSGAERCWAKR